MTKTQRQDPFKPLRDRGITASVRKGRGYDPYYGQHHPLHDPKRVQKILDAYQLAPNQRAAYTRWTNAARDKGHDGSDERTRVDLKTGELIAWTNVAHDRGHGDGLLMHKHPFPGEPDILPQLRPRHAVRTTIKGHVHKKLKPEALARHLEEGHALGQVPLEDQWHWHEEVAKYLNPPRPKTTYRHDHATDPLFTGGKRRRATRALWHHMRKRHPRQHANQQPVIGEHEHTRPDHGAAVANRFDIHPQALELLPTAERIYFALEGTPKADAILSAILKTGALASVFDVPSVTLWDAPELVRVARTFLRTMRGGVKPTVIIVCDADWRANDAVDRQAMRCRQALRKHGVIAYVAGPPPCDFEGIHSECVPGEKCKQNGVDDFLAAGGDLDDLMVVDREAPASPVELPALLAEDDTISGSITGLASVLRCRRDAHVVKDRLAMYVDRGLLTVDRELKLEEDEYVGWTWVGNRPVFKIRPDLRATERLVRLGDHSRPDFWSTHHVAQKTRDEHVIEHALAAWADDLKNGGPKFWTTDHVDQAIAAVAEALGLERDTVNDDPAISALRRVTQRCRDMIVRDDPRSSADPTLHADFVVSRSQAYRIRQTKQKTQTAEEAQKMHTTQPDAPTIVERIDTMQASLDLILEQTAETCERLRERFPNNAEIGAAIDKFIDASTADRRLTRSDAC